MRSNIETYKAELTALIKSGAEMQLDLTYQQLAERRSLNKKEEEKKTEYFGTFDREYQRWYTQASAIVRQLLPDRTTEFNSLYLSDPKRKTINNITYSIQDWVNGIRAGRQLIDDNKLYDDIGVVGRKLSTQLKILESVEARFESKLMDISGIVQADLFDTELESARELLKRGFLRGAGAIAGVVLEKHLLHVASQRNIKVPKRHPNISDLNDLLKDGDVVDIPVWRQIQRLADIRNLCSHNKNRPPTDEEVVELIEGVDKVAKTVF